MNFLYLPPYRNIALFGTVSGSAQSTYDPNWLVDGLPGKPLRAGTVSPSWQIIPIAGGPCNFVALFNQNITPGFTINVTGDVTTTMEAPPAFGVPYNPFKFFTEVPLAQNLNLSVTSSVDVIIGQFAAGKALELPRPIQRGGRRIFLKHTKPYDTTTGTIETYRKNKAARRFGGICTLRTAQMVDLQAWYDSTHDGQLPSIIVPDPAVNDAWAVIFEEFTYERLNIDAWIVNMNFIEIPRRIWP